MSKTEYIDKTSLKLLKLYSQRSTLTLKDLAAIYNKDVFDFASPVNHLIENGLLEIHPNHSILHGSELSVDAPLRITYDGRVALESDSKNHRKFIFNEFRAWVTLVIAFIALIVSIISLFI